MPQRNHPRHGEATGPDSPAHSAAPSPDWDGLAHRYSRERRRRSLLRAAGGAAAAVVLCAGALTIATVRHHHTAVGPHPGTVIASVSASARPSPSTTASSTPPAAPSAPSPLEVLSNPALDSAPLTAGSLFAGSRLTVGPMTYQRIAVAVGACSSGADPALALVLERHHCQRLLRATYTGADHQAVTVAVAVYPDAASAAAVKQTASGALKPLDGSSAAQRFCHATVCRTSVNAVGRYGILFLVGTLGNAPLTGNDGAAEQAGQDVAAFVFDQLMARGSAEAARSAASASTISAL